MKTRIQWREKNGLCGKTREWLYDHLKRDGYDRIEDILYGEWSETDGFYIKTYP
ncbi:hypothetical protein ABER98_14560 [Domibacillus aminovorans]|uniref:hypothetical protein n=1 Tax=Domibacillus aminovorans TaxID=29332 RepID=UPI003D203270